MTQKNCCPPNWKITLDRKSTNFICFRCSVSSLLDMNSLKIRNLDGGGGGLVAQSCLTLYDPTDCSLPGSSVHKILSARILEWVAIPFSRGSSQPKDQTSVSFVSFLAPLPRRCHQKPWKKLKPDQASFFKRQKSKICFLLIIKVLCNHYGKLIKKRIKKTNHHLVTQKWPSILQDIYSQFVCVYVCVYLSPALELNMIYLNIFM